MIKFIHLSDLHIRDARNNDNYTHKKIVDFIIKKYDIKSNVDEVVETPEIEGGAGEGELEEVVETRSLNDDEITDLESKEKPIILLTGDIVHGGKEKQYINAIEILGPLVEEGKFKVLACPGNHDYSLDGRTFSNDARLLFQKYILKHLVKIDRLQNRNDMVEELYPREDKFGGVTFIGLDTALGNKDRPSFFERGKVGEKQRKALEHILRNNKQVGEIENFVVYFHHHPFPRKISGIQVQDMEDSYLLTDILKNKVEFVCFGHKHESKRWNLKDDIEWIFASGKATDKQDNNKYQFREIAIDGANNDVTMVTFKI